MKAVLTKQFNQSSISELPKPKISTDEVLVNVSRVQLSVTECLLFRGEPIAHHDTIKNRIANGDYSLFGHEFTGEVVAVGEDVSTVSVGTRVYVPGKPPCRSCEYCRSGYSHFCTNKQSLGFDRPGALAEYISLPADAVQELPQRITDAAGAAMQPLASSVLCTLDADISPGDIVAVVGTGVVGFQCAQLAANFGAQEVLCIDVRKKPLEIARDEGLTTIDAKTTDVSEAVAQITNSIGADVVFEAAGGTQTNATEGNDPLALAYQIVRTGGTIVQVGHIVGDVSMTPRKFRSKSIKWVNPRKGVVSVGPNATTGTIATQMVADGDVTIDRYITHELDGLHSFEKAVDITLNKSEYGALGPAQLIL